MEPGPKFRLKYLKGSEATQISRFWKDPAEAPNPFLACWARKENFHGILKHGFKQNGY
jgi:hypothetical protein